MDIKTAFDVARPKHIATVMRNQNVHGWITAASLREMAGWKRSGYLRECREQVPVSRAASARRVLKLLGCGSKWQCRTCGTLKKSGRGQVWVFLVTHDMEAVIKLAASDLEQMMKDLTEEAERWDLEPKPASLWWARTFADEKIEDMLFRTT